MKSSNLIFLVIFMITLFKSYYSTSLEEKFFNSIKSGDVNSFLNVIKGLDMNVDPQKKEILDEVSVLVKKIYDRTVNDQKLDSPSKAVEKKLVVATEVHDGSKKLLDIVQKFVGDTQFKQLKKVVALAEFQKTGKVSNLLELMR